MHQRPASDIATYTTRCVAEFRPPLRLAPPSSADLEIKASLPMPCCHSPQTHCHPAGGWLHNKCMPSPFRSPHVCKGKPVKGLHCSCPGYPRRSPTPAVSAGPIFHNMQPSPIKPLPGPQVPLGCVGDGAPHRQQRVRGHAAGGLGLHRRPDAGAEHLGATGGPAAHAEHAERGCEQSLARLLGPCGTACTHTLVQNLVACAAHRHHEEWGCEQSLAQLSSTCTHTVGLVAIAGAAHAEHEERGCEQSLVGYALACWAGCLRECSDPARILCSGCTYAAPMLMVWGSGCTRPSGQRRFPWLQGAAAVAGAQLQLQRPWLSSTVCCLLASHCMAHHGGPCRGTLNPKPYIPNPKSVVQLSCMHLLVWPPSAHLVRL